MTKTPESPIIAVSQVRSFEDNKRFLERHLPLERELSQHGARLIALNGAKDREGGNSFSRFYTFDEDRSGLTLHDNSVNVDSALDLTGGVAKFTPEVAALNPAAVREIAKSKHSQFETLKSLGDFVPITLIADATPVSMLEALAEIPSEKVIMKADGDPGKVKPMFVGAKTEAIAILEDFLKKANPAKDKFVIQEYLDGVHADFADGITPLDKDERERVESTRNLNREIRVNLIDAKPIAVLGRVGLDPANGSPDDTFVYIDQQSVPDHITELAANAARLIMDRAEAVDSHLAIDLTPDGQKIIEVNGRNIGTITYREDRPATKEAHESTTRAIAGKLVSMADRNRKEVQ